MHVTLSYAERILNALARTKHTRDVIHNCQVDADAINEILKPLFDRVKTLEARIAELTRKPVDDEFPCTVWRD